MLVLVVALVVVVVAVMVVATVTVVIMAMSVTVAVIMLLLAMIILSATDNVASREGVDYNSVRILMFMEHFGRTQATVCSVVFNFIFAKTRFKLVDCINGW